MIYDLSKIIDKERFKKRCNQLFKAGKLVELSDRTNRSLSQNSYLHLIIAYLGVELGLSPEYVKREYYKIASNPDLFVRTKTDQLTGKQVNVLRSSSDLTKEEMTLSIQRFLYWSANVAEVTLPEPDDQNFLRECEVEVDRNKQYEYGQRVD